MSLTDLYQYMFTDSADPRTNDWPLISSPVPGLTILAAYLYFVKSWGPRYMANRKSYKLDNAIIVYNLIQVVLSTYMVYDSMNGFLIIVGHVNPSILKLVQREARGFYIYLLSKLSELLDTVFFVLRKKDRQVSFLHVYHHTLMPVVSWMAVKYFPGGNITFICFLNSFVHIVMYSYYLLSALGPQMQKYLWWKKYITSLQLIQFCMFFVHSSQLLWNDCGFRKWSLILVLPNVILMYFLFSSFYRRSYTPANGVKSEKPKQNISLESNNNETWKVKEFNSKRPSFADNNLLLKEPNNKAKII